MGTSSVIKGELKGFNMYIQFKLLKHTPVMGTSSVIKGELKGFNMY